MHTASRHSLDRPIHHQAARNLKQLTVVVGHPLHTEALGLVGAAAGGGKREGGCGAGVSWMGKRRSRTCTGITRTLTYAPWQSSAYHPGRAAQPMHGCNHVI